MDNQVIPQIEDLVKKSFTVKVGDQEYSALGLKPVYNDPRPEPLVTGTLVSLGQYVRESLENLDQEKAFIHVESIEEVSLQTEYDGPSKRRTKIVRVLLDKDLKEFPFGNFMAPEEFMIKLKSLFQPTPDLADCIELASKTVTTNEIGTLDDGISQTLQVKKGVSGGLREGMVTKGIVKLKPYRTFRELDQPESDFILRLKPGSETTLPTMTLFEADGGAWKLTALKTIKEFLISQETILPILA